MLAPSAAVSRTWRSRPLNRERLHVHWPSHRHNRVRLLLSTSLPSLTDVLMCMETGAAPIGLNGSIRVTKAEVTLKGWGEMSPENPWQEQWEVGFTSVF